MKEIIKGVYRTGEVRNPSGTPLMIVHPWFRERAFSQPFSLWAPNLREGKGDYKANLGSLLSSSKGKRSVILLEQSSEVISSSERIGKLFGEDDFYVVETMPFSDEPMADVEESYKFLSGFGSEVLLAGGYLRERESGKYDGCLGCFRNELGRRGIQGSFVEGSCYTWPK